MQIGCLGIEMTIDDRFNGKTSLSEQDNIEREFYSKCGKLNITLVQHTYSISNTKAIARL